jgi:hypothetical protein
MMDPPLLRKAILAMTARLTSKAVTHQKGQLCEEMPLRSTQRTNVVSYAMPGQKINDEEITSFKKFKFCSFATINK